MNNTYDLKSIVRFITHRNKIYSFFKYIDINKMNLPFDKLLEYLNNKQIFINKFIIFLKSSYEINISNKEFNLVFMIYFHHESIITQQSNNSNDVIESAKKIIDHIESFDPYDRFCILKTINRFKRFIKNFNKWKEVDKKDLISELGSEFYRLENIKNDLKNKPDDKLYINELEKIKLIDDQQEQIMSEIKKCNGLDIFNNLQPIEIQYDEDTIKNIKSILEDQYWAMLKDDLKKIPIDSSYIIKLLGEIKDIVYLILNKRVDMLVDLEKKVNIIQLQEEFDTHYFLDGLNYLLELLRKLQSPEYDKLTDNYLKEIRHNMIEGNDLHEFVPQILKYVMNGFFVVLIEKQQAFEIFNEWKKKKNENK